MVCIYCSGNTQVTNSRPQVRSNSVWRRRHCSVCQAIFTTIEQSDLEKSLMINSTAGLEPFLRDKLFVTIYNSLKHRKTALGDAVALTATIISLALKQVRGGIVEKTILMSITENVLKRFDKTAAAYFVAYHPKVSS